MKALDKKLGRDLAQSWAQVVTVTLVVASGVGTYIASMSTWTSLVGSRDQFYEGARFADVFARVRSAPDRILDDIRAVPGVAAAEGRIFETLRVEVPDFDEPVRGGFLSLSRTTPPLNAVYLRSGYLPTRTDEVLVSELFAKEHRLVVGSRLEVLAAGSKSTLHVAGIAVSPEHLWVMEEGSMLGDNRRYGVFWMEHHALADLAGYRSTFNDLAVDVVPGVSKEQVIDRIDALLAPWGSLGAYDRTKQASNRIVTQEIGQLRGMATILPSMFLAVAAFLVNVLLSRIVQLQREQIAALEALGYRKREIGQHYFLLAIAMALPGSILGIGLGAWLGGAFVAMYQDYFRFPVLALDLQVSTVLAGTSISVISALVGAFVAVRKALKIAPAEAMRPEAPRQYRPTVLEKLGIHKHLPMSMRMVFRDMERQPFRTALSAIGVAFATSIVVSGYGSFNSFDRLMLLQFEKIQREDVSVAFFRPMERSVLDRLERIEGVLRVEGQRTVGARWTRGAVSRETALMVVPKGLTLRQCLGKDDLPVQMVPGGVLISRTLAELFHADVGDGLDVELLGLPRARTVSGGGAYPVYTLEVAGLVDDLLGLAAYIDEESFLRLTGESAAYTEAYLEVDSSRLEAIQHALSGFPQVLGVVRPAHARDMFSKQMTDLLVGYQVVLAIFSMILAVGLVYNNTRIALMARSRDFATLRILGFSREEVRSILVGEQFVQLVLGIPLGCWLGEKFVELSLSSADRELFRLTADVHFETYLLGAFLMLSTGIVSSLVVGRKLGKMDLVAVLKARD